MTLRSIFSSRPPDSTLSRRERERRARRQAILRAARAVFAERGFDQATLDEVAARAEFGKGTLYNYFEGGKEAILLAIFDEVFDAFDAIVEAHVANDGDKPVQALFRDLLADLIRHFEQNKDTFLLLIKEVQRVMLSPQDPITAEVQARDRQLQESLKAPIARAIEAGQLRPFPPEAIARTLIGNMQGFLMHHYCSLEDPAATRSSIAEDTADFITSLLFDGLRPRPDQPLGVSSQS